MRRRLNIFYDEWEKKKFAPASSITPSQTQLCAIFESRGLKEIYYRTANELKSSLKLHDFAIKHAPVISKAFLPQADG